MGPRSGGIDRVQNIKSILIGLTKEFGPDETSSALAYGVSLAQQAGAHATVQAASIKLTLSSAGVSKVVAGLVREESQRLHSLAQAARTEEAHAASVGVACSTESPHLISYPELLAVFRMQARLHDLTIDRGLIEALLMESGRPLLVVPRKQDIFRAQQNHRSLGCRAARAAADALPFLRVAEAVEVIAVAGEWTFPPHPPVLTPRYT